MDNQDHDRIVNAVKEISDAHWEEKQSPLLLSALAPRLEAKAPGYRAALAPRTLKAFINDTGSVAGYKLFVHPTQQARVGVAPAEADYQFPPELTTPSSAIAAKSSQEATLAFFRALATLPEADLGQLVIPVSVLVKLLK